MLRTEHHRAIHAAATRLHAPTCPENALSRQIILECAAVRRCSCSCGKTIVVPANEIW